MRSGTCEGGGKRDGGDFCFFFFLFLFHMGKVQEVMEYLAAYSSKHFDFTFSVPQLPYRLVHLALMVNYVNCHDYCDRELTWCLSLLPL